MAQFTITGPDKRSVTITAPDDATPELIQQKLDLVKSQWGKEARPLSWSDVPGQALRNAPGSAARLVGNIAQTVMHPIETAQNLGNLAYGVGSKIGGALGVEQDPQRKSANEAPADAVGAFFKDRYGSAEGLKKTLANDPVGALADAATVLTGGGALVARAPGVAGQVGRVAGRVGSTIDPIAGGVRLAGGTASKAGEAAAAIAGMTTGAGKMPIEYAYKAGRQGNTAFTDHMRGNAPLTDVGDMAKSAVSDLTKDRSNAYKAGMANVKGQGLINFDPIKYAVNDAFDMVHFKGVPKSQEAANVVKSIENVVGTWEQIPTSQYRSAEGLDALKQAIGEIRQKTQYGTLERAVADKVYNRVKDQIVKQVPEYANVMKGYSNASEQIKDITKTFSLGEKSSKDTALRSLTSVLRNNVNTNFGQRAKLMDEMAVKQPDLPYAIAGQALNSPTPRGLNQAVAGGAVGYGATINPAALAALPLASPRIVGEAAYGAGKISQGFENALLKLGLTPDQFVNALRALNQTGNALSGGIGPRYDENGNLR
jgi:hypothetical protein